MRSNENTTKISMNDQDLITKFGRFEFVSVNINDLAATKRHFSIFDQRPFQREQTTKREPRKSEVRIITMEMILCAMSAAYQYVSSLALSLLRAHTLSLCT